MEKFEIKIETITPMFCAGADTAKFELRDASIKGLLRYWWRALQAENNLDVLRRNEENIFGSTEKGRIISIKINYDVINPTKETFPRHLVPVEGKSFPINILEYLAYGTYEYVPKKGNLFKREYIPAGLNFKINVCIFKENVAYEILKAFYLWNLFGGIGSRSRNGFGGFDILSKNEVFKPLEREYLIDNPYDKNNFNKLIKAVDARSYSSFSRGTKLYRTKEKFDSWDKALAEVGKIYRESRMKLENRHVFNKRQYIGSPIVEKRVTRSFLERHAKPYFIRISRESGKFQPYILYLPSRYCDGLEKDRNNSNIKHDETNNEFKKVCDEFNIFLKGKMEEII